MESIVYIISTITVFILAILIKKSEEKLEIVKTIAITTGLHLAYNTLICYLLNLVNIPITLISLAVTNYITAGIILFIIIKNKQLQKYYISKTNILVAVLCILLAAIIIGINFNYLTKIRYISMDSREHYMVTREFSENNCLTNKAKENNSREKNFLPGAYTNVGVLFKALKPFIGTIELYKVFILFEAMMYVLTGMIFYMLIEKYINSMTGKIIAIVLSLIYLFGYPLNAWISGFHYLLLGILYIEMVLYVLEEIENKKARRILLFFTNFGLIMSYPLFCAFTYIGELIIILFKDCRKDKNSTSLIKRIINKEKVIDVVFCIILPTILGLLYLINPQYSKGVESIALDGWLYKNLWSNFMLLIPFNIYAIYKEIKQKEFFNIKNVTTCFLIIFMIVLFIGTKIGKVSEYYFYKNYFILWFVVFMNFIKGILLFIKEEKEKYIAILYVIVYIIIFVLMLINQKTWISETNTDRLNRTMEVFTFNKTMMEIDTAFFKKEDLELMKKTEKYVNWKKLDYLIISDPNKQSWIKGLTGYDEPLYKNAMEKLEELENKEYKYLVIFKDSSLYNRIKPLIDFSELKLIEESEAGYIYVKKGE